MVKIEGYLRSEIRGIEASPVESLQWHYVEDFVRDCQPVRYAVLAAKKLRNASVTCDDKLVIARIFHDLTDDFLAIEMSVYEPNTRHMREVLIFCFDVKKPAAEAHRMLPNTYGETAIHIIEVTCCEWFQRLKNGDSDIEDRDGGGREKLFKDAKLEAIIHENSCQTQEESAGSLGMTQQTISKSLKVLESIPIQVNRVPYDVKLRDVVCLRTAV